MQVLSVSKSQSLMRGHTGPLLLAGSLAVAIVPSLLTFPNTINEVCRPAGPLLGSLDLTYNAVWMVLLLAATAGLGMDSFLRKCRRAPKPADSSAADRRSSVRARRRSTT